jgi:hypothetical protein
MALPRLPKLEKIAVAESGRTVKPEARRVWRRQTVAPEPAPPPEKPPGLYPTIERVDPAYRARAPSAAEQLPRGSTMVEWWPLSAVSLGLSLTDHVGDVVAAVSIPTVST